MLARVKRILQGASGPPLAENIKPLSPKKHTKLSDDKRISSAPLSPRQRSRSRSPLCRVGNTTRRQSSLAGRRPSFACASKASRRRSATAARLSFPHRDFANPEAETCWLSCLFQALWHSVVFHTTFEAHLALEVYSPSQDEVLLTALQQTWAEYKAEGSKLEQETPVEAGGESLVPADCLVDGFGEGYGDMSEALACLQAELCESGNAVAIGLSERIVLLPMTAIGEDFPTPASAWKQAQEWQVTGASLIAVDLSIPLLPQDGIFDLARFWVPEAGDSQNLDGLEGKAANAVDAVARAASGCSDALGGPGHSHRLVALVCYMWNIQHYVAFCRRQSDPSSSVFFNDLPELTQGVPKEVSWVGVPELCKRFSLQPRLMLYEAIEIAS